MRYKFRYVSKEGALELEWEEEVSNRKTYREKRIITEVYKLSRNEEKIVKVLSDNEAHNVMVIASMVYGAANYINMSNIKLLIEMINRKIEKSNIKKQESDLKTLKVIQNVGRKQIWNSGSTRGRVEIRCSIGEKRAKRASGAKEKEER